jgi:hypothetical protein
MMKPFDRKAVEKVLTDCGWKIDPFISTCFGGIRYGLDGKYPQGAAFTHKIFDTIFILVKGDVDPTESRSKNRWEIIAGSNYGRRVGAAPLAYGYTATLLARILTPQIAIPRK